MRYSRAPRVAVAFSISRSRAGGGASRACRGVSRACRGAGGGGGARAGPAPPLGGAGAHIQSLKVAIQSLTNSCTWGGVSRTNSHAQHISTRQKATHEHAQHVEEETVQPADYRAARVIEIERQRATTRSWPLSRRRLIAPLLVRSVV